MPLMLTCELIPDAVRLLVNLTRKIGHLHELNSLKISSTEITENLMPTYYHYFGRYFMPVSI